MAAIISYIKFVVISFVCLFRLLFFFSLKTNFDNRMTAVNVIMN